MDQNQSFFQKYKKEIIIVLISLITFSLVLYFLFFNNKKTDTVNKNGILPSISGFFDNIFGNKNENGDNNLNEGDTDYYFESLIRVWDNPVAGYGFYEKDYSFTYTDEDGILQNATDTATILIFIDSISGDIYEKNLLEATSSPIKIAESSYKDIRKAYFLNDKNNFKNKIIFQYLEKNTVKTISATIPNYFGTPANLLNITNLPNNITNINLSKNNKYLSFIVKRGVGSDYYSDWYELTANGNNSGIKVYTSKNSDWKLLIDDNEKIYAYNTDSAYEQSNLYKLDKNKLNNIYFGHTGQAFFINKDSLLTSIFTNSGVKTYINTNFNKNTFNDTNLNLLSFNTIINKCGGGDNILICAVPKSIKNYDSGLPDSWYQGMTSFDDNLYIINSDYPNGQLLYDFNTDGNIYEKLDIKDLKINNLNTHLMFINKYDASLWTLNIDNILNEGGD